VLAKAAGYKCELPENIRITPQEFEVVKALASFPDTIREAAEKYEPCYIARFAVDLAQKFNKFYFDCKILTAEDDVKGTRILLTKATLQTLKNALGLLGIGVPDKM
jgi:arginyl-tRNA synthetase